MELQLNILQCLLASFIQDILTSKTPEENSQYCKNDYWYLKFLDVVFHIRFKTLIFFEKLYVFKYKICVFYMISRNVWALCYTHESPLGHGHQSHYQLGHGHHCCLFKIAVCTDSRRALITLLGSVAPVTAVPDTIMLAPACHNTHCLVNCWGAHSVVKIKQNI